MCVTLCFIGERMTENVVLLQDLVNCEQAIVKILLPAASEALEALKQGELDKFQTFASQYTLALDNIGAKVRPIFENLRKQGISEEPLPPVYSTQPLQVFSQHQMLQGLEVVLSELARVIANHSKQ